jgi:hypothetical protein
MRSWARLLPQRPAAMLTDRRQCALGLRCMPGIEWRRHHPSFAPSASE